MSCGDHGEGGCGHDHGPPDPVNALCEAARYGHLPYIQRAVAADATLAMGIGKDGFTALHLAAHYGHTDIAELLVEAGASIHARSSSAIAPGNTPLHAAVAGDHANVVAMLLERGAAVNARQEKSGFTPLHVAAFAAGADVVKLLLEYDADRSVLSVEGQTAKDMAVLKGKWDLAELLTPPPSTDRVMPPEWENEKPFA